MYELVDDRTNKPVGSRIFSCKADAVKFQLFLSKEGIFTKIRMKWK